MNRGYEPQPNATVLEVTAKPDLMTTVLDVEIKGASIAPANLWRKTDRELWTALDLHRLMVASDSQLTFETEPGLECWPWLSERRAGDPPRIGERLLLSRWWTVWQAAASRKPAEEWRRLGLLRAPY